MRPKGWQCCPGGRLRHGAPASSSSFPNRWRSSVCTANTNTPISQRKPARTPICPTNGISTSDMISQSAAPNRTSAPKTPQTRTDRRRSIAGESERARITSRQMNPASPVGAATNAHANAICRAVSSEPRLMSAKSIANAVVAVPSVASSTSRNKCGGRSERTPAALDGDASGGFEATAVTVHQQSVVYRDRHARAKQGLEGRHAPVNHLGCLRDRHAF